jgi:hypothetical protein
MRLRIRLPIVIAIFAAVFIMYVILTGVGSKEAFGTSPGTMTQLATSHVPTAEDMVFYNTVYPKLVRKEITMLTDGDPGEFRPWIFPWYGRGVALIH